LNASLTNTTRCPSAEIDAEELSPFENEPSLAVLAQAIEPALVSLTKMSVDWFQSPGTRLDAELENVT
jgi:hypothetical protein